MTIDAIPQFSYNQNVNFGSLTGVNKRPQEQIEQGKQYQTGLNGNYQIKPASRPTGTLEGIEQLEQQKAQGYDPGEIDEAFTQAYEEMSDPKALNYIFAEKQTNDDGELSPKYDGFALYC